MKKTLFIILISTQVIFSQNIDSLFVAGNNLYKNGKYEEAIKTYRKIEAKKFVSAELFYNLGNSYYKMNRVGPSIYYYEKALKLNPLHNDTKNNLIFARRLALDNIELLPQTLIQKFKKRYVKLLSYDQWAVFTIIFSFVGSLAFFMFYTSKNSSTKKTYFIISAISFILLSLALFTTYSRYKYSKNNIEAIVFAEEVTVRSAPILNSEKIFQLHEGTKVLVLDSIDSWKKIKISDGKLGWLISEDIKLLTD